MAPVHPLFPPPFKQMSKNTRSSVVGRFRAAVQLRAFHPLLHITSSENELRTRRPPCTHKLSQKAQRHCFATRYIQNQRQIQTQLIETVSPPRFFLYRFSIAGNPV